MASDVPRARNLMAIDVILTDSRTSDAVTAASLGTTSTFGRPLTHAVELATSSFLVLNRIELALVDEHALCKVSNMYKVKKRDKPR
jgi:hypothetical protein